jgi:hypothetical protein
VPYLPQAVQEEVTMTIQEVIANDILRRKERERRRQWIVECPRLHAVMQEHYRRKHSPFFKARTNRTVLINRR